VSETKFEVIIPTLGGRETYLQWAVRSCLDQDYPNFQVLVSNNGGASSVRDVISDFGDSRIRYIETDRLLPMAVHWEFAISHATGDVLTIIGDDDALMPAALKRLNDIFLQNQDIECVTHYPGQYFWPDYPEPSYRNRFSVKQGTEILEIVETKPVLRRVTEFRAWYGQLPFLYHGFLKRTVLERIRASQGLIFKRTAPDIYSDLLLAVVMDRYARFDGCLTFGGQGARSNGANFLLNNEEGKQFLADLPDYLSPRYYVGNIHIQLFEYFEIIGELFPQTREHLNVSWLKFAGLAILEALSTPAHCQNALQQLRWLAKNKIPLDYRHLTNLLLTLFKWRWAREMASAVLLKRKNKKMQGWKNASVAGVHNIYHLTRLIGEPLKGNQSTAQ